jgi:hypothetical protein
MMCDVDTVRLALPRRRSVKSWWSTRKSDLLWCTIRHISVLWCTIRHMSVLWCTIRHMSGSKGLVLLCQMRSEIDGRVSIEHRLSCSLDRAACPCFVQSVPDRGKCKCVPYNGECSNKVLNNGPFWVVSSPASSNRFHLVRRGQNKGQSFEGKMEQLSLFTG